MNTEELKRLAEAATPGPWIKRGYVLGIGCGVDGVTAVAHHTTSADADFIAAANPAAILALIAEIDSLRDEVNGLTGELGRERERLDFSLNREGFYDHTTRVFFCDRAFKIAKPQVRIETDDPRATIDDLLAALKDAREMVSDWAGYASPYFQEKHDIDGDLKKLDDAIARMEG